MKREVLHSYSASSSIGSLASSKVSLNHDKAESVCGDSVSNVSFTPSHSQNNIVGQIGNNVGRSRNRCRDFCRQTFKKKNWSRTFPILKWAPNYTTHKLIADFIAGFTVGLTILPQGLAYATVAGLPPIYGLYSGFVGPLVYILLGSTKVITIGPNAIQCILTYKFTHDKSPEYAVFLCMFSGIVNLLMAFMRLGFVANFISTPVISGFTSAIAITIVSTQVNNLLGLNIADAGFVSTCIGTFENITSIKKWDALLGLTCIIFLVFLENLQCLCSFWSKARPKLDRFLWIVATSRNAIIMTVCTIIAAMWNKETQPFSLVGKLVPGLPEFKPPPLSIYDPKTNTTEYLGDILHTLSSALFIMPLLGLMGHISIAKAFAGPARVDATQECLAIGVTNIFSSFFSSMPISGSFSRTTVNAFSGAETPAGGLVTGLMVILALQYLTEFFYNIPKASLAAVVCTSVVHMVDLTIIRPMWRSKKSDLLPWGLTFLTTLLIGMEYGILTGLVISIIFLLYYAARPRVKVMKGMTSQGTEFILVELDRSLTYPSVDYITDKIVKAVVRWGNQLTPIVIDCHHIQFVDFTAAQALKNMVVSFNNDGYKLIFWKVKSAVRSVVHGVMENSDVAFIHCKTEQEMEVLVETAVKNGMPEVISTST